MAQVFVAVLLMLLSPGLSIHHDWISAIPSDPFLLSYYPHRPMNHRNPPEGSDSKMVRNYGINSLMTGKKPTPGYNSEKGMGGIFGSVFGGNLRTNHLNAKFNRGILRNGKECLTVDYYIDPRFEYNVQMIQAALDDISASACILFRQSKSRSIPLSIMMKEEEGEFDESDCQVLYGKREVFFGKDCLTRKHVMSVILRWLNYCPADVEEETQGKVITSARSRFFLKNGRRTRSYRSRPIIRDGSVVYDNGNLITVGEFNKSTVSTDSRKLYCEDGLPVCCIIASLNGCSLFYGFTSKFCPGSCSTAVEENTCGDTNPNCPRWGSENKCLANQALMREICPMSCGFCSPNDFCFDTAPNCQDLAENGECERNPEYMVTACRESCKFCKAHRNCTDHDANCPSFVGGQQCLDEDTQAICPLSCGLCKADDEPEVCGNFQEECPAYKENGFCETHPKFMRKFCPKACGFCEVGHDEHAEQEVQEPEVEETFCLIGGEGTRKCDSNPAFIKRYCSIHVPGQAIQEMLD